jgi:hypothetical protein
METPPALSVFANQAYDNDGLPIASLGIIWNEQLRRGVGAAGGGGVCFPRCVTRSGKSRGSLRIGQCVGSPVFWCADDAATTLLIGPDDESWGVSMNLPLAALDQISAALHEHRDWLATTPQFIISPRRPAD